MAYETRFAGSNEHRASVWTRRTANFDGAAPETSRQLLLRRRPPATTLLIKDGVLVGRLHSRETAGKLGKRLPAMLAVSTTTMPQLSA